MKKNGQGTYRDSSPARNGLDLSGGKFRITSGENGELLNYLYECKMVETVLQKERIRSTGRAHQNCNAAPSPLPFEWTVWTLWSDANCKLWR